MLRLKWGQYMIDYRIYELDGGGRVFSPARIIQCEDDDDAVSQAVLLSADRAVEIWAGKRRVGLIPLDQ
jgi:hypothetical protein